MSRAADWQDDRPSPVTIDCDGARCEAHFEGTASPAYPHQARHQAIDDGWVPIHGGWGAMLCPACARGRR